MEIEKVILSNTSLEASKKAILNILHTQSVVADCFNEVLKPYDLSSEQYNVLRILRGQKGNPANMYTIQERMLTKSSNTTRLVDKLLHKNLVARNVCPNNRRKIEVLITEKGLQILTEIDPKANEHEEKFAKNLNKTELETLNHLLEKYRTL